MVIDGKQIAAGIIARLKQRPRPEKFLAAVLVGGDPASVSFITQKERAAGELGVNFRLFQFPENIEQTKLMKEIERTASDAACGGIVLQLPLPAGLDRDAAVAALPKEKDVDNLRGDAAVLAPAVGVVDEILKTKNSKLKTMCAAVVGAQGFLIGRPVTAWLKSQGASVAELNTGGDLSILKNADLIVLGAGSPGFVKPEMLKDGVLVIDFGYGKKQMANGEWRMAGDFDPSALKTQNSKLTTISYTPTPGGTGPMVVAKLLENFYTLNAK